MCGVMYIPLLLLNKQLHFMYILTILWFFLGIKSLMFLIANASKSFDKKVHLYLELLCTHNCQGERLMALKSIAQNKSYLTGYNGQHQSLF